MYKTLITSFFECLKYSAQNIKFLNKQAVSEASSDYSTWCSKCSSEDVLWESLVHFPGLIIVPATQLVDVNKTLGPQTRSRPRPSHTLSRLSHRDWDYNHDSAASIFWAVHILNPLLDLWFTVPVWAIFFNRSFKEDRDKLLLRNSSTYFLLCIPFPIATLQVKFCLLRQKNAWCCHLQSHSLVSVSLSCGFIKVPATCSYF